MSGPGLFSNQRARNGVDEPCCVAWLEFVDERLAQRRTWNRAEAMVHHLSHSGVPFSAAQLTQLAGCSQLTAAAAIRMAVDCCWLAPVATYGGNDPALYGGRLT